MSRINNVGYAETTTYQVLEGLEQSKHLEVMEPLTLCHCGIEQCKPRHRFGPHVREEYLIHVVLSGKGVYRVGKQAFELEAGQAFLIRPGEDTVYRADEADPWYYTWIGFSGYKAPDIVKEMGFGPERYVINLNNVDLIKEAISTIIASRTLSFANELRRKSQFYAVLTYLVEGNEHRDDHLQDKENEELRKVYVRRATDYMMSSYNKKIRISDIADEIGLNRSYLTNIFKKEMNMSPQDFLITFRLKKAAELLRETNESVRTIAFSTGYDDSLSFSKAFKQKYHMTPSAYRATQIQLIEHVDMPSAVEC